MNTNHHQKSGPLPPTPGALGCPNWCELEPEQHAPEWHDGALRIDHQRAAGRPGLGTVILCQEARYRPAGRDALALELGPVSVAVDAVALEVVGVEELHELARALTEAAAMLATLGGVVPDAVAASCAGGHAFTLGRCGRCGAVAPGVEGPGVSSGDVCQVLRCGQPAAWRVTFGHSSPVDPRPFSAVYCEAHAVAHDGLSSVSERVRIGGRR